jgi:hypothetical protein
MIQEMEQKISELNEELRIKASLRFNRGNQTKRIKTKEFEGQTDFPEPKPASNSGEENENTKSTYSHLGGPDSYYGRDGREYPNPCRKPSYQGQRFRDKAGTEMEQRDGYGS